MSAVVPGLSLQIGAIGAAREDGFKASIGDGSPHLAHHVPSVDVPLQAPLGSRHVRRHRMHPGHALRPGDGNFPEQVLQGLRPLGVVGFRSILALC